jgi:putative pyruvate formate lyase activating enzyme
MMIIKKAKSSDQKRNKNICAPASTQQSHVFRSKNAAHEGTTLLYYKACALCPRNCSIDRTQTEFGYCGESDQLRIAAIEAHFGEEPPISGTNGSGTIFFTGCSLKCSYCQNYQISHQKLGSVYSVTEVVDRIMQLHDDRNIPNVNFVTPDHFFPYTIQIVHKLRELGVDIPSVYNLSGYQKIASLQLIEPVADIFLPDYKYSDPELAQQLSNANNYPELALAAIAEMVRQKGFLDSFSKKKDSQIDLAKKGVLVRHLILPGQVENSINALTTLFLEFGKELPLSLMSQYCPVQTYPFDFLNRAVTRDEFNQVLEHALELGFKNMFVQYPDHDSAMRQFLPDFSQDKPFLGNIH